MHAKSTWFARHIGALVPVLAIGFLIACDDVSAPIVKPNDPPLQPVVIDMTWQHPFPQGNDLNRMWGFPDGSFYAVGDAGTVLQFNGSTWALHDVPTRADLHGVWASNPGDIYAAGYEGTLLHFDGVDWTSIKTPARADLYAVHLNSPDDLFITGLGGSVWNRFGGTWTEYIVAPGQRLQALLGYAHDEVYVCGSNASFFRFNGVNWSKVPMGLAVTGDTEYRDLWGPGPGMFSILVGGGFVWTDGTAWNALNEGNGRTAHGLWGVSLDNQVMVAAELSTHLIDGIDRTFPTPTEEPLYDVWGPTRDNYFAVGRSGNVAHFDGIGWQALSRGSTSELRDLWVGGNTAVAVGANGTVLRRNGAEWVSDNVDGGYDLSGVWETDGLAIAVGRHAPNGRDWRLAVLMNTGATWTDAGPVGTAHRLFDVWGSSASDVYAVGWGGEVIHYDGATWSEVMPDSGDIAMLRSVSGTSSSNVIAVGRTNDLRGFAVRFDGNAWTTWVLSNSEELNAVWVESPVRAIAVGSLGTILRFDGAKWTVMQTPTTDALFAVWGTSSRDVYAVGWEGTILHYDGDRWRRFISTTNRTFNAVMGRGPTDDVLFAGDRGSILSYQPGTVAKTSEHRERGGLEAH